MSVVETRDVVHMAKDELDSSVDTEDRHTSAGVVAQVVHTDCGHVDRESEGKLPKPESSTEGYGRWAGRGAACGQLRP